MKFLLRNSGWLVMIALLMVSGCSSRRVLRINPQFGQVQIVTETREDEMCPSSSPDGKQVAYVKYRRSAEGRWNFDIVSRPTSGGYVEREITTTSTDEYSPAFYPDGKKIIYSAEEGERIYLARINAEGGSAITELTRTGYCYDGRISKDGGKVFFTRSVVPPTIAVKKEIAEPPQMMLMDENGFNITYIGEGITPDVAPDGKRVCFSRIENEHWRLYHMNVDGTDLKRIWTGIENADDIRPSWSPSGKSLVFVSNRNKVRRYSQLWKLWKFFNIVLGERQWDLYKVDIDGSNLVRISTDDRDEYWPSWAVGGAIYFQSNLRGNWDIYRINIR